jgi:hypothetical protein
MVRAAQEMSACRCDFPRILLAKADGMRWRAPKRLSRRTVGEVGEVGEMECNQRERVVSRNG